jgi:hypothetical protein
VPDVVRTDVETPEDGQQAKTGRTHSQRRAIALTALSNRSQES